LASPDCEPHFNMVYTVNFISLGLAIYSLTTPEHSLVAWQFYPTRHGLSHDVEIHPLADSQARTRTERLRRSAHRDHPHSSPQPQDDNQISPILSADDNQILTLDTQCSKLKCCRHCNSANMSPFHNLARPLDSQQSTLDARRSTLDTRHSTLDAQNSTLDTRRSPDGSLRSGKQTRMLTLDARCSTLDSRQSNASLTPTLDSNPPCSSRVGYPGSMGEDATTVPRISLTKQRRRKLFTRPSVFISPHVGFATSSHQACCGFPATGSL